MINLYILVNRMQSRSSLGIITSKLDPDEPEPFYRPTICSARGVHLTPSLQGKLVKSHHPFTFRPMRPQPLQRHGLLGAVIRMNNSFKSAMALQFLNPLQIHRYIPFTGTHCPPCLRTAPPRSTPQPNTQSVTRIATYRVLNRAQYIETFQAFPIYRHHES